MFVVPSYKDSNLKMILLDMFHNNQTINFRNADLFSTMQCSCPLDREETTLPLGYPFIMNTYWPIRYK